MLKAMEQIGWTLALLGGLIGIIVLGVSTLVFLAAISEWLVEHAKTHGGLSAFAIAFGGSAVLTVVGLIVGHLSHEAIKKRST